LHCTKLFILQNNNKWLTQNFWRSENTVHEFGIFGQTRSKTAIENHKQVWSFSLHMQAKTLIACMQIIHLNTSSQNVNNYKQCKININGCTVYCPFEYNSRHALRIEEFKGLLKLSCTQKGYSDIWYIFRDFSLVNFSCDYILYMHTKKTFWYLMFFRGFLGQFELPICHLGITGIGLGWMSNKLNVIIIHNIEFKL